MEKQPVYEADVTIGQDHLLVVEVPETLAGATVHMTLEEMEDLEWIEDEGEGEEDFLPAEEEKDPSYHERLAIWFSVLAVLCMYYFQGKLGLSDPQLIGWGLLFFACSMAVSVIPRMGGKPGENFVRFGIGVGIFIFSVGLACY